MTRAAGTETLIEQAERLEVEAAARSWKPYPAYRDSGVEWLGRVPNHWHVKRLKHCCSRSALYGANISADHYQSDGVRFLRTSDIDDHGCLAPAETRAVYLDPSLVHDYILSDGDILLSRSATLGRSFIYDATRHGPCAYAGYLVRFVPADQLHPPFAFYFTKSGSFEQWVNLAAIAATIGNVNGQKFANVEIPVPPLPEQRAIAAFLDRKTRQIDELIEKKRRLIDLLQEKRTALISHAVTKGLNSDAPMEPSGIDWLGDVPEHWEVKRLRHAAMFQRGHDLPLDSRAAGDVPIVTSAGPSAWHDTAIAPGPAIVTGRYGTIGAFHLIDQPFWPLNTTLYTIDLWGNRPRFLWYMLHILKPVFLMEAGKSAVPGVDRNDLHPIPIAIPPADEQAAIEAYLDWEVERIASVTTSVEQVIRTLIEYRQSLISAAVTGKIDVRERGA